MTTAAGAAFTGTADMAGSSAAPLLSPFLLALNNLRANHNIQIQTTTTAPDRTKQSQTHVRLASSSFGASRQPSPPCTQSNEHPSAHAITMKTKQQTKDSECGLPYRPLDDALRRCLCVFKGFISTTASRANTATSQQNKEHIHSPLVSCVSALRLGFSAICGLNSL